MAIGILFPFSALRASVGLAAARQLFCVALRNAAELLGAHPNRQDDLYPQVWKMALTTIAGKFTGAINGISATATRGRLEVGHAGNRIYQSHLGQRTSLGVAWSLSARTLHPALRSSPLSTTHDFSRRFSCCCADRKSFGTIGIGNDVWT